METLDLILQKLKTIQISNTQTPFNALNLMYNEVLRKEELQSKIIGGFLNPIENHGFGDIPLTLFLNRIFPENNFGITQNSQFSIDLERPVIPPGMPARRIDILLSWKDNKNQKHAIIIENKLNWASNQSNQLNDYYDCLIVEGYDVEGLVYMPFLSEFQHSRQTDTKKNVLAKTKDFDAKKLVEWLKEIIKNSNDKEISSIIQYKEFWENLLTNNYTKMKAIEIIEHLSIEEINKIENLAKIVSSNEWCEARFNIITKKIENHFNENLKMLFKKYYDKYVEKTYNYVEYYFDPYEYWVELHLKENQIELYVVTNIDKDETIIIDKLVFSNKSYKNNHYYYYNEEYLRFDYSEIAKIEQIVVSILKELQKYEIINIKQIDFDIDIHENKL